MFKFMLFLIVTSFATEPMSIHQKLYRPRKLPGSQKIGLLMSSGELRQLELKSERAGEPIADDQSNIILIETQADFDDLPEPTQLPLAKTMGGANQLSQHYVFAHFRHSSIQNPEESQLYWALLPKKVKVQNSQLLIRKSRTKASASAHIRLKLDQPISLLPMTSESSTLSSLESGDLIFSLNKLLSQSEVGVSNPFQSLFSETAVALPVESTESFIRREASNHKIESWELGLDSQTRKKLFSNLLSFSHQKHNSGLHHLVFNNSVTHVLLGLKSVSPDVKTSHFKAHTLATYLQKELSMGLTENVSLNEEFSNILSEAERVPTLAHSPVLERRKFDTLLRQLTEDIINSRLSYSELNWTQVENRRQASVQRGPQNTGPKLWALIEKHWKVHFHGQDIQLFFEALEQLDGDI